MERWEFVKAWDYIPLDIKLRIVMTNTYDAFFCDWLELREDHANLYKNGDRIGEVYYKNIMVVR